MILQGMPEIRMINIAIGRQDIAVTDLAHDQKIEEDRVLLLVLNGKEVNTVETEQCPDLVDLHLVKSREVVITAVDER
jgi:hypothetical protein